MQIPSVFLLFALVFAGCLQPAAVPTATPTFTPSTNVSISPAATATPLPTLAPAEISSVFFQTSQGRFELAVEIADTPEEHARGLMNRSSLAQNAGMLFLFPEENLRYFWMKDTLIPLDMVFLSSEGKVVALAEDAQPCRSQSCSIYGSEVPSRYVVEANAGYVRSIGLSIGDEAGFSPK